MMTIVCRKTVIAPCIAVATIGLFLHDYHSLDFRPDSVLGKTVLVTGASRGIGRQLAIHYARLGAKVVITSRDEAALLRVKEECLDASREAESGESGVTSSPSSSSSSSSIISHIVADFSDFTPERAQELISSAVSVLEGRLDFLVLNHAISTLGFWEGSLENVTLARKAVNVNYLSYLLLASASQPYLEASGGSVVVVSSATARWPMPSVAHYGASKAAMDSFFRSLSLEWKLREKNVAVTVCVLGLIKTKRYIDNMSAFNPNGTDSLAFALGADPSETASFIIKGAALRKPQIRYPFLQFLLGDIMELLPRPLKLLAMKKTLPMIS